MMRILPPMFFIVAFFVPVISWSQAMPLTTSLNDQTVPASVEEPSTQTDEWSIYTDQESKTIYIDFEHFSVNLNDIVVKNEKGQIVLQEAVFDLPVNTIYEVDYQEYSPGVYEIELRSFTRVLRKTFQVN